MKRFNISVNGKAYDVQVEEISGSAPAPVQTAPFAAPAAPVQAAPAPVAAAPAPAPVSSGSDGNVLVKSPMPGTIIDVKVSVGDTVSVAQPLVILEAMKMENDIVAPSAGKVASIKVKKGDSVNSDDLLITLE